MLIFDIQSRYSLASGTICLNVNEYPVIISEFLDTLSTVAQKAEKINKVSCH